jgi:hypothetical protein
MAGKYVSGPKFVTPRAAAIWPNLNTPDTKHNADGTYDCKQELQLDDPIVQKIKAKAMEVARAEYEKQLEENPTFLTEEAYEAKVAELKAAKKDRLIEKLKVIRFVEPMLPEIDDNGDETGTVMLKAKRKASGTYKKGPKQGQRWTAKPKIFNARGAELKNPPKIGGGSEVKMSIELKPYFVAGTGQVGCSFNLEAVQLITLVQFGQRDAAGYGFGSEDGDDLDDDHTPAFQNEEGGEASSSDDDEL